MAQYARKSDLKAQLISSAIDKGLSGLFGFAAHHMERQEDKRRFQAAEDRRGREELSKLYQMAQTDPQAAQMLSQDPYYQKLMAKAGSSQTPEYSRGYAGPGGQQMFAADLPPMGAQMEIPSAPVAPYSPYRAPGPESADAISGRMQSPAQPEMVFEPLDVGVPEQPEMVFEPLDVGAPEQPEMVFPPLDVGSPSEDSWKENLFVTPQAGEYPPFPGPAPPQRSALQEQLTSPVLGAPGSPGEVGDPPVYGQPSAPPLPPWLRPGYKGSFTDEQLHQRLNQDPRLGLYSPPVPGDVTAPAPGTEEYIAAQRMALAGGHMGAPTVSRTPEADKLSQWDQLIGIGKGRCSAQALGALAEGGRKLATDRRFAGMEATQENLTTFGESLKRQYPDQAAEIQSRMDALREAISKSKSDAERIAEAKASTKAGGRGSASSDPFLQSLDKYISTARSSAVGYATEAQKELLQRDPNKRAPSLFKSSAATYGKMRKFAADRERYFDLVYRQGMQPEAAWDLVTNPKAPAADRGAAKGAPRGKATRTPTRAPAAPTQPPEAAPEDAVPGGMAGLFRRMDDAYGTDPDFARRRAAQTGLVTGKGGLYGTAERTVTMNTAFDKAPEELAAARMIDGKVTDILRRAAAAEDAGQRVALFQEAKKVDPSAKLTLLQDSVLQMARENPSTKLGGIVAKLDRATENIAAKTPTSLEANLAAVRYVDDLNEAHERLREDGEGKVNYRTNTIARSAIPEKVLMYLMRMRPEVIPKMTPALQKKFHQRELDAALGIRR